MTYLLRSEDTTERSLKPKSNNCAAQLYVVSFACQAATRVTTSTREVRESSLGCCIQIHSMLPRHS